MSNNLMACSSAYSLQVKCEAAVAKEVVPGDFCACLFKPGDKAWIVGVTEKYGFCHGLHFYCLADSVTSTAAMLGAAMSRVSTSSFVKGE